MSAEVVLRRCSSCKDTKPLHEFHKNKNRHLGHNYECKECKSLYQKSDAGKLVQRNWRRKPSRKTCLGLYNKSQKGRITQNSYKRRARLQQDVKQKDRARSAVAYAIEQGILTRPKICSQCTNIGLIEAHHHNGYNDDHLLDVIWLCKDCHVLAG